VTVDSFNALAAAKAEEVMFGCCASHRFALAMAGGRPYLTAAAAITAVDTAFRSLTWDDVVEAMDGHPRIGERRLTGHSAAEQSLVRESSVAALAAGNAAYEERFGHVFLIAAAGRTGEEMLAALRERLNNDEGTERSVVMNELRLITRLRVHKALAG
jgi:2-oxo-4-hydroxy-4-carboxy-5-ureidoimidazoline decarboxylase